MKLQWKQWHYHKQPGLRRALFTSHCTWLSGGQTQITSWNPSSKGQRKCSFTFPGTALGWNRCPCEKATFEQAPDQQGGAN